MKKIAFIVSKFPCYDEAFILREIHALSHEMDIMIFSLKPSKEKIIHDEARELLGKTVYVPYIFSARILAAQIVMFLKCPLDYLRAFFQLVLGNIHHPEFLLKNLIFFPKAVYLAQWIQKKGVDHLHAYWATYPTSVALAASQIAKIPFSFTGHAHDIYLDTMHLPEKMRRAQFISTCTTQNSKHLQTVAPGVSSGKIAVNYHGLRLEEFAVNEKKRNDVFQILSVGTLHFYKGFNFFFQALRILKDHGLKFRATVVGGGPLKQDLKRHLRLLDLKKEVTMTGPLKQAEVIPYYKSADLFVLMAQAEWHWGIPNVLIEALAAKTPVITTRFGSVEELVEEGVTGFLVPSKDSEALAQAIERFYRDEPLRKKMAGAGYRRVAEDFDLEKNIRQLAERFQHETIPALIA